MPSKEVSFQPGRFSPVVEVSQRETSVPAPADTSFTGLEEAAKTTLLVANAAARGRGAVISDPTPVSIVSLVLGSVLTVRNVVEQLMFLGKHCRIGTPATKPNGDFLEPLVRAYNFYGHFSHDSKLYVTRGLENILVESLFLLRRYATNEVASGEKYTVRGGSTPLTDIDTSFYSLGDTGDIEFGRRYPLKVYLEKLVSYISGNDDLGTADQRIPLMQQVLEISTEDALSAFLRYARTLSGWSPPTRQTDDSPTDKHKAAMKKIFGSEYSSPGDLIPNAKFVEGVNCAYALLRRVSLERSYAMKTLHIPKYEGGSASQLAWIVDDVLYSTTPLSLVDSTAALAFTTAHGGIRRHHSAPGHERDELLRELVSQSLIK